MKYLLLVAIFNGSGVEPPDAGPYNSLKECQDAAIEYIMTNAGKLGEGQGAIVKCKPVERNYDTYVR